MPRAKKPDFDEPAEAEASKPVALVDICNSLLRLPRGEIRYVARQLVIWLKTHPPGAQVGGPPLLPTPTPLKETADDGPPHPGNEVPVVREDGDAGVAVPGDGVGVPDGVLGVWDVPGDAAT